MNDLNYFSFYIAEINFAAVVVLVGEEEEK